MSPRVKDVIGLVFRLVLAGILGFAGLTKIFEEDGARTAIMAYRVFPVEWTGVLGWALPAMEILLAVLLLVGLFTRWAALLTGLLMVAFIAGIAQMLPTISNVQEIGGFAKTIVFPTVPVAVAHKKADWEVVNGVALTKDIANQWRAGLARQRAAAQPQG